ncbi:RimK family alpha-L-glutamate ligase [Polaribacter sp. IC063]|uniref:ATP-grasp domain-containing protein n=1 Tax=Polaribacter sp. IC063 TaxID=57031 RepID=UPI0011BF0737|nr:hypothetical protein [Polaribacter sp. IC063]TXD51437.1 hypothetical protein ES043_12055 [Polaribacter sp. IC063]
MKLAIHHREGSFSDRWIAYCKEQGIRFKIVNCYDTNIIEHLKDCNALMWHHHHADNKDVITAKRILFALEQGGIKVFPNFKTGWHFDDKVAQKYLLESINAPLVPSYVFYDKKEALGWANVTIYPKVFKLKGGAGSANVKLVRTKAQCIKFINKAFGKGFKQFDGKTNFLDTIKKYKSGTKSFKQVIKSFGRVLVSTDYAKNAKNEKGYAYFQEFLPNNDSDIRVIIIGKKAFAVKRLTLKNDFRASGSGEKKYDTEEIDFRCIEKAFEINKKIKAQSIGYDFIFDKNKNPLIVEIGYGFAIEFYDPCPGYWTEDMQFHKGEFVPQNWMVQDMIESIK